MVGAAGGAPTDRAADADLPPAASRRIRSTAYLNAFALLDRHEIIGLAITLSVLCFAVVAAILLVRTRERLAATEANARDEIIAEPRRGRPRLRAAALGAANPGGLGRPATTSPRSSATSAW